MELSSGDLAELGRAKQLLEKTSFAVRLANAIGKPVDAFVKALPAGASDMAMSTTHKALEKALATAVWSLQRQRAKPNEGLPVHRHLHGSRGSVYAFQHELDGWRAGRAKADADDAVAISASVNPAPARSHLSKPVARSSSILRRQTRDRLMRCISGRADVQRRRSSNESAHDAPIR